MSPAPSSFDVRAALLTAARDELVEHGHSAISLRAVARRAGVSHAAPKYHFGDRAGLLTAVAADGFRALADALDDVAGTGPQDHLAALGEVYIDFGLANPALFDLMFRPAELTVTDADLLAAQSAAIGFLTVAVGESVPPADGSQPPPPLALLSWALAHGLAVLARDGALGTAAGARSDLADLAHSLVRLYAGMTPRGE